MALRETLGVNEFKEKKASIWKAILAEFLGNLLLNFFGCASCVLNPIQVYYPLIALTFGFTIFVLVQTLGHVSGGHFNPAVTIAMIVTQNISLLKGLLYIIVQCLGAIAGSAILRGASSDIQIATGLGATVKAGDIEPAQGFLVEAILGFVLVLTVFGVVDTNRLESKAVGPLAIGLAVGFGHLACLSYTGSSMNPARSLGSAVVGDIWQDHWIYWVGPILGGIVAGLLYKYVFAAPSTGSLKIIERYTAVVADEKELKRLDGATREP